MLGHAREKGLDGSLVWLAFQGSSSTTVYLGSSTTLYPYPSCIGDLASKIFVLHRKMAMVLSFQACIAI